MAVGRATTGPYDAAMVTAAPAVPAGTLSEDLARAVEQAKAGDALAPVTVVAPHTHAVMWARMGAVFEQAAFGRAGMVNVRVTTLADLAGVPDHHGPFVLIEPAWHTEAEEALVRSLQARPGSITVESNADAPCTELRPCATGADEARAAVRAVLAGLQGGVPLWQHAIFHGGRPMARLVHRELVDAGLAACGPAVRLLREGAGGRGLVGLLELTASDLQRDAVMSWLASVPAVATTARGEPAPTLRWDALSAEAGVGRGIAEWRDRLGRLAATSEDDRHAALALGSFVEDLAVALSPPADTSWARWAAWARHLVSRFLAPGSGWAADERDGLAQVDAVLQELGQRQGTAAPATADAFAAVVHTELEARTLETAALGPSAFGRGVFVAPYHLARGMRFDTVVLVGAFDPTADESRADDIAVALRAGTSRRVATTVGPTSPPVRFTDSMTRSVGIEAFAPTSRAALPPLHAVELRRRALARAGPESVPGCGPVSAEPGLAAGVAMSLARLGRAFGRFDGWVGQGPVNPFDPGRPMSATRLETYAECPRRFLFSRVLGVQPRLRPESVWRIDARDRGSLVHAILERYVQARVDGTPRSLELLETLATACLDAAGEATSVGRALLWRLERLAMLRDLRAFYAEEPDDEPLAAELAFGIEESDAAPAVEVLLSDGRALRFQGRIDRVDRSADGALVVSDYKTGRQAGLTRLTTDPLDGGRHLQLPLYAMAARAHFGAAPVQARFWMVSAERQVPTYRIDLTEELEAHFGDMAGRLALAVDSGVFPGAPGLSRAGGFERCRWCDFDRVCPLRRDRQWAVKRADPVLAPVTRASELSVPGALGGAVTPGPVTPEDGE